jgi:hypothetical protein
MSWCIPVMLGAMASETVEVSVRATTAMRENRSTSSNERSPSGEGWHGALIWGRFGAVLWRGLAASTLMSVNLDAQTATIVALIGVVVGVIGVAIGTIALAKLSRLRHSYSLLQVAEGRETYIDVLARTLERFNEIQDEMLAQEYSINQLKSGLRDSLNHIAVVRYDALDNLSGRYSFSAAIVDDYGDGLIVTTIHGRSDTRSYLKEITAGKSDIDLSPEESEAISTALGRTKTMEKSA